MGGDGDHESERMKYGGALQDCFKAHIRCEYMCFVFLHEMVGYNCFIDFFL